MCSVYQWSLRPAPPSNTWMVSTWAVFTSGILAPIKGHPITSFSPWLDFPERTSAPKLGKECLQSPNFRRLTLGSVPNENSKNPVEEILLRRNCTKQAIITLPCFQGKLSDLYAWLCHFDVGIILHKYLA